MIIITGAAGFISSAVLSFFNKKGIKDIILVDEFSHPSKNINFEGKDFISKIHRDDFLPWFEKNAADVDFVMHLGARTDTAEMDVALFNKLNLDYSKSIWHICTENNIPLIYASSAATYGGGEHGYDDNHEIVEKLTPLNPYGDSKNDFDKWMLHQDSHPPFWAGLKFFNVYGPNEFHKARMASVVLHTFRQIETSGKMKLFRSHNPDFKNGHQSRDFIYIKDIVEIIYFLYNEKPTNGLYNLGTGKARTFLDLASNTFHALGLQPDISFIDTPIDIRDNYQYFTEANMTKLKAAGYNKPFHSLEEGVKDYVQNYLKGQNYY